MAALAQRLALEVNAEVLDHPVGSCVDDDHGVRRPGLIGNDCIGNVREEGGLPASLTFRLKASTTMLVLVLIATVSSGSPAELPLAGVAFHQPS